MTSHRTLWETHMHTAESSRCGQSSAADMVQAYHSAGYQGIVVADHFFNGNTAAPRSGPWQKRIDGLVRGYKVAKKVGEPLGMFVLLSWEFTWRNADFLTFGLEEDFLRDQPDLASLDIDTYVQRVHAAGGLVVQAHPYRQAWYMPNTVQQRWDIVDAIEVFNGSHGPRRHDWDDQALALAQEHHLIQTAGSDAHSVEAAATAGIVFEEEITNMQDFAAALHQQKGCIIREHP